MKKIFLLFFAQVLFLITSAQNIKLTQKQQADDIKVINGDYTLYFKPAHLIAAIAEIEKANNSDLSAISGPIKEKKVKSIDMKSTLDADKPYIDLLFSNLGCYLLSRGRVFIKKGNKTITSVFADESPEIRELDGSSRVAIGYSDNEMPVFQGELNMKLKVKN